MRRSLIVIFMLLSLCSCHRSLKDIQQQVGFIGIESMSGSPLDTLTLNMKVRNQTGFRIGVENARATLHSSGSTLATATLAEPVTIMKGDTVSVRCRLKIGVSNPLAAFSLITGMRNGNAAGLTVDVEATLKVAGFSRQIERKNIPLDRITGKLLGK